MRIATLTQSRAQGQQHVEDHAHTRQRSRLELRALKRRVDDSAGPRQHLRRKVMIRDQHINAKAPGVGHSVHCSDPVVDGHDQRWNITRKRFSHPIYNRWRQAVAVGEAVWHQIVHAIRVKAEHPETQHRDGSTRCSVTVIVTHDHDVLT